MHFIKRLTSNVRHTSACSRLLADCLNWLTTPVSDYKTTVKLRPPTFRSADCTKEGPLRKRNGFQNLQPKKGGVPGEPGPPKSLPSSHRNARRLILTRFDRRASMDTNGAPGSRGTGHGRDKTQNKKIKPIQEHATPRISSATVVRWFGSGEQSQKWARKAAEAGKHAGN